jgi:hypothetical protein
MKRRTNPNRSLRPSSRLAAFFVGLPPLSRCDSMSDADAWLAIVQAREVMPVCATVEENQAFNEYAAEFLRDRGLVERVTPSGLELCRDGLAIAGLWEPSDPALELL